MPFLFLGISPSHIIVHSSHHGPSPNRTQSQRTNNWGTCQSPGSCLHAMAHLHIFKLADQQGTWRRSLYPWPLSRVHRRWWPPTFNQCCCPGSHPDAITHCEFFLEFCEPSSNVFWLLGCHPSYHPMRVVTITQSMSLIVVLPIILVEHIPARPPSKLSSHMCSHHHLKYVPHRCLAHHPHQITHNYLIAILGQAMTAPP